MFTLLSLRKLISFIDHSNYSDNNTRYPVINFNNKKISGRIVCYTFENGFSMLDTNIKTLSPCIVQNDTVNEKKKREFFFIYFYENTAATLRLKNGEEHTINKPCLLITNTQEEIFFNKDTIINAFILVGTEGWLEEQGMQLQPSFISQLSKAESLFLRNLVYYRTSQKDLLRARITAFNLFLYSLEKQINLAENISPSVEDHKEALNAIEQKILNHLYTSAPSIEEMAREFYMSPSTLKRQFKRVFGSNIYEYYLRHKMQLAKNILENQHLKVSEVAAQLHYENVSQFIRIFKKVNGILPGHMSKQQ